MDEVRGIQVAAVDEADLLDSPRLWKRVDLETLRANLSELLDGVGAALPPENAAASTGFRISQIQVAVVVGAKGQVGLLGTGAELSGQASLTVTLERPTPNGVGP